jgi:hypothetical protein
MISGSESIRTRVLRLALRIPDNCCALA